jgi:hypothetical protein
MNGVIPWSIFKELIYILFCQILNQNSWPLPKLPCWDNLLSPFIQWYCMSSKRTHYNYVDNKSAITLSKNLKFHA